MSGFLFLQTRSVFRALGTKWSTIQVNNWYGGSVREVEVCTDTAVWYHAGLPTGALRWVLVRDPQGAFEPQALLSSGLSYTPVQILAWFVRRWTMEVTFAEARAHLGLETQRQCVKTEFSPYRQCQKNWQGFPG